MIQIILLSSEKILNVLWKKKKKKKDKSAPKQERFSGGNSRLKGLEHLRSEIIFTSGLVMIEKGAGLLVQI